MKDTDFLDNLEMTWTGSFFTPENQPAMELADRCVRGEVVAFKEITARDLSFHRCYFSLLNMVWRYLPKKFRDAVPEKDFYKFLKHLKGEYKVLYKFLDGKEMVEYESIAFGKMSQKRFEEYIAEQLPWIYSNVIGLFFSGEIYDDIIKVIEDEYEVFLNNLVG